MSELKSVITIEQMGFRDLTKVYDLGNKLFTADKWQNLYRFWDEYEILERFIADDKYSLVAKSEKKIIGFAIGTVIEKEQNSWTYGYIVWMGVDPKHAGKGVGKKLLQRMTKLFRAQGVKIMMVDTASDNEAALKFFKKHHFEPTEGHVFLSKNISKKK